MKSQYLIIFLSLFLCTIAQGGHIKGGEMFYNCLGPASAPNTYLFKVTQLYYIDCSSSVENVIPFVLWHESDYEQVSAILDTIYSIPIPEYDCLEIPTSTCTERRIYAIEIELTISDSSYYIANHFCCRSFDIANIENSNDVGVSFYVEITPDAQLVCNNSPEFQEAPPVILCVNTPFTIYPDIFEVEGDQMVYQMCAPEHHDDFALYLQPPPFISVPYILPTYSPLDPLGSGSLVLDANTGILSGTPTIVGKFVLGLCVSEYRNGQYLGTTRRDIQINIVPCMPQVNANILSDEITFDGAYVFNSCLEQTITFNNISTQVEYIDSIQWRFEMGSPANSNDWSPTIYFPEGGTYSAMLVLNPDKECSDTANIIVNIVEEIESQLSAIYDTCISGPVHFESQSYAIGSNINNWVWDFGDSIQSLEQTPVHYYDNPGIYPVQLIITDEFGCKDSVMQVIEWKPAPEVIIIAPDLLQGCAPLAVQFDNLSWPIDSTFEISWLFGDNKSANNILAPKHIYEEEGIYTVEISINSPLGCFVDSVFVNLITVEAGPVASFNYTPSRVSSISPEVEFLDQSQRAVSWNWNFSNIDSTIISNPTYIFPDTGLHSVQLTVLDKYGCKDSIIEWLDIVPFTTYFFPNAFTPNGDGLNDEFKGKGLLMGITDFEMKIWNKWGTKVFHTTDPEEAWNGRHYNKGKLLMNGVYIYTISYQSARDGNNTKEGLVTLIR